MKLVLGGGHLDRTVEHAELLLAEFLENDLGRDYYSYFPITPSDCLYPEDLGITLIFNSRPTSEAARSLMLSGSGIDLSRLPNKLLEEADDSERAVVAQVITEIAGLPGIAASIATKILHKKRPQLIPVLDNQAIFGAYLKPSWPSRLSSNGSVKTFPRIKQAVDWIAFDLTREENITVWNELRDIAPTSSLIEIFDMVWWMYFRHRGN
jgi:hypothetical protein